MIETLFKQKSTVDRLQSGPFTQHLPFIADVLHQEQYPAESIRRYVRVAEGFGRWLCKSRLRLAEADETTLARYRASISRRGNGQLRAAGRGLPKLLMLLRMQHAVREPVTVSQTENDLLSAAAKEGATLADQNGPDRHELTAARCRQYRKIDKVFFAVSF